MRIHPRTGPAILAALWTLSAHPAAAATIVVTPDGAGDYPTIQEAVDAAVPGDIIELEDGTYRGDGNRDIEYRGKSVTVRSRSGDPEACIIDCEGEEFNPHRGFFFRGGEDSTAVLEGVTITNGIELQNTGEG